LRKRQRFEKAAALYLMILSEKNLIRGNVEIEKSKKSRRFGRLLLCQQFELSSAVLARAVAVYHLNDNHGGVGRLASAEEEYHRSSAPRASRRPAAL
jgi:hypothetical protein